MYSYLPSAFISRLLRRLLLVLYRNSNNIPSLIYNIKNLSLTYSSRTVGRIVAEGGARVSCLVGTGGGRKGSEGYFPFTVQ